MITKESRENVHKRRYVASLYADTEDNQGNISEDQWRTSNGNRLIPLTATTAHRATTAATHQRENLCKWLVPKVKCHGNMNTSAEDNMGTIDYEINFYFLYFLINIVFISS